MPSPRKARNLVWAAYRGSMATVVPRGRSNGAGASRHSGGAPFSCVRVPTGASGWRPRCALRQELLGESGIRDRIEINLDGCMAPINPASGMPIADLTIAHKRVEALCQSIGAKHSVLDWKHHGAFRHGAFRVVDMARYLLAPSHDRPSSQGIDSFGKYLDQLKGAFRGPVAGSRRTLDRVLLDDVRCTGWTHGVSEQRNPRERRRGRDGASLVDDEHDRVDRKSVV